jgi:hypothetical protein
MEESGFGSVQVMTDPDPGCQRTYGSGSGSTTVECAKIFAFPSIFTVWSSKPQARRKPLTHREKHGEFTEDSRQL